jgi:glycosyltransferase involved in cell wall biosynthesis
MHILVLTQNNVAQPQYGGALRVAALLDQLHKHGITFSVIRFRRADEPPSPAGSKVHDIVVTRGYLLPPVAALNHLALSGAEQVALEINRISRIDMVQSDPPWAALTGYRLAQRLGVPHVLLAQNCETTLATSISATGPARRLPLVGSLLADFNIAVIKWAERRAIAGARLTLTPSPHDLDELASVGIKPIGVDVLPNGTSVYRLPGDARRTVRQRLGIADNAPVAIFVGRMDYPPNRAAVQAICDRIGQRCPGVVFLLVGLNPPAISTPPNVRMIGRVESVDEYLTASDLAIVPITCGSGTRIKILDAWGAGLPVLSTATGASGLDYHEGVDIAIENDLDRFPERIRELLESPAKRSSMGSAALSAARPYRWDAIGQQYVTYLRTAIAAA